VNRLLVANRAEIARRVFRTARAMGIGTVAVFTDADEDAPHVRDADVAVRIDSYLDVDAVLDAARRTGADAVHPGYGFLSENAGFARACAAAGITFVGPSPQAIDAMGSKIAAKELMAEAGVPVLGSEGFPLLVKASFGGGGRGMRIVRDESELQEALASAEREAAAAFGDGTVFVERYVEDPRHIEVQIFGDTHGNVVHLYERECSIQRRYQKVIEEAPSPAVDDELRERLGAAAVAAGKALGYVGAGTVEFVLDRTGDFFFLEVNTRLQVEHPVTELVTGLDLVELQLRVARGEPLPPVPPLQGHAVEARLYAEDVPAGFVPVSGRIDRFDVPLGEGIRVDSGYEAGSTVSTFYDAMLAKVIALGDTRDRAVQRLADCLDATRVHGVTTNRSMLVRVLRHPEFLAGATDTGFLARHGLTDEAVDPAAVRRHAVAAALAAAAGRRAEARVQPLVPSGWRNVAAMPQVATFTVGDEQVEVRYRGHDVEGVERVWSASPSEVDLTIDGVRRRIAVERIGSVSYVDDDEASTVLVDVERFPLPDAAVAAGSLLAPLPGSVVRVLVEAGATVTRGQTLVVLEAMKMEHSIQSPSDGTVTEVPVQVGQQVETGQVLVVVDG
jgi:propionyl-CoA carboxylase alpha chain